MSTQVHVSDAERPSLRRLPIGAECLRGGGVHFRVWAPRAQRVAVVLGARGDDGEAALAAETNGYFSGCAARGGRGHALPLPPRRRRALSRSGLALPAGGPTARRRSSIRRRFRWTDAGWAGAPLRGQVIYEMHVGTFTPEGTWAAATRAARRPRRSRHHVHRDDAGRRVPRPLRLGLRRRQPLRAHAALRRARRLPPLRRRAHAPRPRRHPRRRLQPPRPRRQLPPRVLAGLLHRPAHRRVGRRDQLRRPRLRAGARVLPRQRARYWIDEFHLDGLRLDATQSIFDASAEHILAAIATRGAGRGAGDARRSSSPRTSRSRRAWSGRSSAAATGSTRCGTTTSTTRAIVALTGQARGLLHRLPRLAAGARSRRPSGATSTRGSATRGSGSRRGTPALDLPPWAFVTFLENHDQVANSARGQRVHQLTSPGRYRALTALPAARPGHADAVPGTGVRLLRPVPLLRRPPRRARRARCARAAPRSWRSSRASPRPRCIATLPDPSRSGHVRALQARFRRARTARTSIYALHRDLLRLRRARPGVPRAAAARRRRRVLGPEAFVLRFFGEPTDAAPTACSS